MSETRPYTDLLAWNVQNGGFTSEGEPRREAAIKDLIIAQQVDTAALSDTFGWNEHYGGDTGIAEHLGFKAARFAYLNDDRINELLGPGAGVTLATNHPIEDSRSLDLDNREGLRVILNVGGRALQIALMYLDDTNEDIRLQQVRAGLSGLEKGLPTILKGDFTSLPEDMEGAALRSKIHDVGFRAVTFCLNILPEKTTVDSVLETIDQAKITRRIEKIEKIADFKKKLTDKTKHLDAKLDYYQQSLKEMNRREVIPEVERYERRRFRSADPKKQTTVRKFFLRACVDHTLVDHEVAVTENSFKVIPAKGASDHDATRLKATIL